MGSPVLAPESEGCVAHTQDCDTGFYI